MRFPRFSRRTPAPRPAFVWRWVYPVVLVGFVAAAALLADAGLENALNIKDGTVTQVETDPCKPGFLAEVEPTPTMLIIETDADNDAVGLTAMSLGADGQGGWVLQLPLETRLKDGKFLWQVWREASPSADSDAPGKAAMARAVGKLLGFSFLNDVVVLPTKTLASFVAPVLPVTVTLDTPVQTVSADGRSQTPLFPAGAVSIDNEREVVQLFETMGPVALSRLKRQGELWAAWITALRSSPSALAAFEPDDQALVTYINALVTGPSEFRTLPVENEIPYLGLLIVDPDFAQTATLAARMVPFPLMIEPGARLRTALFNGTADCNLTLDAATRFVENGAQIDVLGNTTTADVARSEVIYYDAELKSRVDEFARSLGIDSAPRLIAGESAVDMTVTLGADFKG